MGRPKLLLPYGDTTIVGALIATLRAARVRPLLVVAHGDSELAAWARSEGIEIAFNREPERGMLSSIVTALEHWGGARTLSARLQRQATPVVVSPCDLPRLRAATVDQLLGELARSERLLAVPTYQGRRGHPLALDPACLPDIPRLDTGVGLRQLLQRRSGDLLHVAVDDPGVIIDVDTPADYEALVDERGHNPTIAPPRPDRTGDRAASKERG